MRKWYPALLIVATLVASLIVFPRLPARVPTHWDLHGHVNGMGSRWVATFLMPALLLCLWGLFRFLPRIDPRRESYARMQGTWDLMVNLVLTLMAALHFIFLAASLGAPVAIGRLIAAVVGVTLVILGNVLPRARPNWWFGIRTPWTLSNDRVWERTHRVGGYVVSIVGVLVILAAIVGVSVAPPAIAVLAAVLALGLVVYSYIVWRQETSR